MDVSLFERMINNGMDCPKLKVQHRMRPEISSLISPAIYEQLDNHYSVTEYESVVGVEKNLFFLKHNALEAEVKIIFHVISTNIFIRDVVQMFRFDESL